MKKNITIVLAALLIAAATFTGCKKDKDNSPAEQELSFHLHTLVGNTAANYTSVFTDATGRSFTLSDCRYYISNIVLIKEDGTELPITGKVLLANPMTAEYEIGMVPVGKYKGYRFFIRNRLCYQSQRSSNLSVIKSAELSESYHALGMESGLYFYDHGRKGGHKCCRQWYT